MQPLEAKLQVSAFPRCPFPVEQCVTIECFLSKDVVSCASLVQACKNSQDSEVLADLGAWLASSGAPERVLNTEKVRSCWIYAPTTNNVDVSCSRPLDSGCTSVIQQLARYAFNKGIASALLRPSVMNAKHAGCTLAHRIYEQIAPDGEVPIACTLQDVVELCHTKNDGDLTGTSTAFKCVHNAV